MLSFVLGSVLWYWGVDWGAGRCEGGLGAEFWGSWGPGVGPGQDECAYEACVACRELPGFWAPNHSTKDLNQAPKPKNPTPKTPNPITQNPCLDLYLGVGGWGLGAWPWVLGLGVVAGKDEGTHKACVGKQLPAP